MQQPEILAPAGTYDAFLAAVHNGCNAVYLGGEKFGARAYANNFDEAALIRVVEYSNLFGVRIYYTINTLIKDNEIEDLLEEVNTMRSIGINTFIVQDIGVIDLLLKTFDDIELHASTQLNCHSSHGVLFLKNMGISRVVLSRELSISEIKHIKETTQMELEAFIHGALCYCYSGQCLMSSFLGGRSGNRGRCAQPCRLRYKTVIDDNVTADSHILSPKDIETLTILPELIDAGIDSFKIEGRMKSKEYVGLMTKLYRYYTDQYISTGQLHIKQQDINDMTQIFNRGDFSNGYYLQHNGPSMMTINQPKNQGVVVGSVKSCKGLKLTISFFEKIKKGDCIEFALSDGSYHSLVVDSDLKATKTILARTNSPVIDGSEVRRIKSVELNERINEANNTIDQKYINMSVHLEADQPMSLTINSDDRYITVYGEVVQVANNQGLTIERVEKQFLKLGNYPVLIQDIYVNIVGNVFAPIGQLNQLRRKALEEWFYLSNVNPCKIKLPVYKRIKNQYNPNKDITVLLKNRDQLDVILGYSIKRVYLEWFNFEREDLNEIIEHCHSIGVEVYLAMPKIIRHENDQMLNLMIEGLSDQLDGFLIRSMDSYSFLKRAGLDVNYQWDYGMSIFNRHSVSYLTQLEPESGYCPSLELNKHDVNRLPLNNAEALVYGYANIMTSAQCARKNTSGCVKEPGKLLYLEDRKGINVPVETVCQLCYNNIYNGISHYLIDKIDEMKEKGIGQFRIDLLNESKQEIEKIMTAAFCENESGNQPVIDTFTRGHYSKGVE